MTKNDPMVVRIDKQGRKYPVAKGPPEGGWAKLPPRPVFEPRAPKRQAPRIAYASGSKTPLEVLSRLAGGTTYRTPDSGRSATGGQGIGVDDIAHALGFVRDPLEQLLALSLACRTVAEWGEVQRLAFPLLLKELLASHTTRALVAGPMRYRIRLVLHDVFHDLALERAEREPKQSAARIKMQARDYSALYKRIAGFVETKAQAGAHAAKCALYNDE